MKLWTEKVKESHPQIFQYIGSIRKYKAMIKKKQLWTNKQKVENEPEIINSNQTDKTFRKKSSQVPSSQPLGQQMASNKK